MPYVKTRDINRLAIALEGSNLKNRAGDPQVEEFMDLLSRYANNIFGNFTSNAHDREDLAQKACLNATRDFRHFDSGRSSYSHIFYTNCKGLMTKQRECAQAKGRTPEDGAHILSIDEKDGNNEWIRLHDNYAGNPLTNAARNEEAEMLEAAIDQLPTTEGEILKQTLRGKSGKEISEDLAIARKSFKQIAYTARKKLKDIIPDSLANNYTDRSR